MVFKSKLKIVENKRCANRPTKTPQTKNYAISLLFKNSPRKRFFFRARFNNAGAENCQTLLQTGLELYFYDFFLSPASSAFRISLSTMNLWLFVVLANFPWGAHISSIVIDTAHAKIASIVPYNRSWEIFFHLTPPPLLLLQYIWIWLYAETENFHIDCLSMPTN